MSRLGCVSETNYRESFELKVPAKPEELGGNGDRSSAQGFNQIREQEGEKTPSNPGTVSFVIQTSDGQSGALNGSSLDLESLLQHLADTQRLRFQHEEISQSQRYQHEAELLRQQAQHERAMLRIKVIARLFFAILALVVALVHPSSQELLREFIEYAQKIGL